MSKKTSLALALAAVWLTTTVAAQVRAFEEDGWWRYPRGQYTSGVALLDALRARVMRQE